VCPHLRGRPGTRPRGGQGTAPHKATSRWPTARSPRRTAGRSLWLRSGDIDRIGQSSPRRASTICSAICSPACPAPQRCSRRDAADDDLVEREQGRGRARLGGEDVERSTGDQPRRDGVCKCLLVHDRATAALTDAHARLDLASSSLRPGRSSQPTSAGGWSRNRHLEELFQCRGARRRSHGAICGHYGSYAISRIPKGGGHLGDEEPHDQAQIPSVLTCSSTPLPLDRSHRPQRAQRGLWEMFGLRNNSATACSAADQMFDWAR